MASHLTITTSASAGISASKGLNTAASAGAEAEGGVLGAFAALLGAASQQASTTTSTETATDPVLGSLVDLSSFGAGFGSEAGDQTENPDAIAAAIDAVLPIQTAVEADPALTELVESLGELKLSLEAGDTVDPELLERIDTALADLAAQLDIDPTALPSLDDLKALATTILPDDTSVAAQLTTALAPLAETLLTGTEESSPNAEFSEQLKSVGEKLAALLQSLNSDDVDADKLAALGLGADAAVDADLEAALAKLTAAPVKVETSAADQVLATPALKLTEPALTGKGAPDASATASAPATETSEASDVKLQVPATSSEDSADTSTGGNANSQDDNRRPADTTATATATAATAAPVAAAVETAAPTDSQVTVLPTHVASRVDAAAARPVVQPGYQTSQQQLNLPQLAFELVRQVADGNTRFQLRLDPAELGKIDVQLDIDASGQVNARLSVERAETLDLMQRDQRSLEKALQQAGLDGAKTNLEFSLKQNSSGQQGQDGNARQPLFGAEVQAEAEEAPLPTINLYRGSLRASGVNIIA